MGAVTPRLTTAHPEGLITLAVLLQAVPDTGKELGVMRLLLAPPDGLEPPTRTLGRCRSIH